MQLSVFRCRLDLRHRARMERELRAVMETGEDRLLVARPDEDRQTAADRAKSERRALTV